MRFGRYGGVMLGGFVRFKRHGEVMLGGFVRNLSLLYYIWCQEKTLKLHSHTN